METGIINKSQVAFLLPAGSSDENVEGGSHLFEHLLVRALRKYFVYASGFTTEDYIILFCSKIKPPAFLNVIEGMKFDENDLYTDKEIIIKEIEEGKSIEAELFFSEVWRNTKYMKSPLGSIDYVKKISPGDLIELKDKIIGSEILCYEFEGNITDLSGNFKPGEKNNNDFNILDKFEIKYKNNLFDIFYIKGGIEKFYLLEKILGMKYPGRHIQINEKKRMSSFIIEKGLRYPVLEEISNLYGEALKLIENEINEIKKSFYDRALNELESIFFYNSTWLNRLEILFNIKDLHLFKVIDKLKHFRGVCHNGYNG
jgi:hypothetical protein